MKSFLFRLSEALHAIVNMARKQNDLTANLILLTLAKGWDTIKGKEYVLIHYFIPNHEVIHPLNSPRDFLISK